MSTARTANIVSPMNPGIAHLFRIMVAPFNQYDERVFPSIIAEAKKVISLINKQSQELDKLLSSTIFRGAYSADRALNCFNVQNDHGDYLFILAVRYGYREIVEELYLAGANINARNKSRRAAIDYAIENKDDRMIHYLVKIGAQNASGDKGLILLIRANCRAVMTELVEAKELALNDRDTSGNTGLMIAEINNNHAIVHELIAAGCDVNISNHYNDTALTLAVFNKHPKIAHELIELKHCNLNHQNRVGNTALILAVMNNDSEMVHKLIIAGAEVNIVNQMGKAALDHAIEQGNLLLISLLLTHHANITAPKSLLDTLYSLDQYDPYLVTCLEILCQQQHIVREAKLADGSVRLDDFIYIEAMGCLNLLKKLNKHFSRPVMPAIAAEAICIPLDVVKIIAEYHISTERNEVQHLFQTRGILDLLRNLNNQERNGDTELMRAIQQNKSDIAHALIAAGADLNNANKAGKKALDYAIKKKNISIVSHLLARAIKIPMKEQAVLLNYLSLYPASDPYRINCLKILNVSIPEATIMAGSLRRWMRWDVSIGASGLQFLQPQRQSQYTAGDDKNNKKLLNPRRT